MEVDKESNPKPSKDQQSFTYKIVSQNRERREAKLRKQFKINPSYCEKALEEMSAKNYYLWQKTLPKDLRF